MPSASSLTPARPQNADETAGALQGAAALGRAVRIAGGRTRREWGRPVAGPCLELSTTGLDRVVEHNRGDLTAVLQAGVRVAEAQRAFAAAGQMLALDAPDPGGATIGGLLATGDSGPLRHRYGAVRDLVLGATVALPDGSVARAGSRVIKNVAGYDLAKLLAGSFGTLGVVVEAVFRLHPLPAATATAVGVGGSAPALASAAAALARAPLELMALDVAWQAERGAVMARAGGAAARETAETAAAALREGGLDVNLHPDDARLWEAQRAAQRAGAGATVVRVSGRASQLPAVIEAADAEGARLVGRAALGLFWLALPALEAPEAIAAVGRLRSRLSPSPCVVQEAPEAVRSGLDPWDLPEGPELALMRRLRARFDPGAICNRGLLIEAA